MDPSEMRLNFYYYCYFFKCVYNERGAGPITGETVSPCGEGAAGCKGLNKGDFIDRVPLDSVLFLQPVVNPSEAESPPLPLRTASLSAPSPALLAAPSPYAAPALPLFFSLFLLSPGFVSVLPRPR